MLKKFYIVALFALLAMGCATTAGTPLQQIEGNWQLSYDATFAVSQELQELVKQDPTLEQYIRSSMDGLVLKVDNKQNKMFIIVENEVEEENDFTVVSESAQEGQIIVDINGDKFTMYIKNNTLEWVEDGDSLVFTRIN